MTFDMQWRYVIGILRDLFFNIAVKTVHYFFIYYSKNIGRLLEFLIKFTNKTAIEFNFSQHWTLKFTDIGISLDNRWEIRQDKH